LQIQKFDSLIIGMLDRIFSLSLNISQFLEEFNINSDNIKINKLYAERELIINNLIENQNKDEWNLFFLENKTKYFKIIADINIIENDNIKSLKKITESYGEQLKNLSKQRALLIYSK